MLIISLTFTNIILVLDLWGQDADDKVINKTILNILNRNFQRSKKYDNMFYIFN